MSASHAPLAIRVTGGPTAVLDIGGLRLVTDPTFDAPGDYVSPSGSVLVKTAPSAAGPADLGPVDLVLLSHDQHPDNLDRSGRAFLARGSARWTRRCSSPAPPARSSSTGRC